MYIYIYIYIHRERERGRCIYYGLAHKSVYLDMGFEPLNLKLCEFK